MVDKGTDTSEQPSDSSSLNIESLLQEFHSLDIEGPHGIQGNIGTQPQGDQHMQEVALTNRNLYGKIRCLLFLQHCNECQALDGRCRYSYACIDGRGLLRHIMNCGNAGCLYPWCVTSKYLLEHHQICTNPICPICLPVEVYNERCRTGLALHKQEVAHQQLNLEVARSNMEAALSNMRVARSSMEAAQSNMEAAQSNMEAAQSNIEATFLQEEAQKLSIL